MPQYKAQAYLVYKDKVVGPGTEIELTEDQAKNLGDKVGPTEENVLAEKTVPELKEIAAEKGIEGYKDMLKDELLKAVKEE
ncbi:Rho termination factor N-terminal domain-containing protein [Priestia megaterium]|uniref:Rho termination factor N-terminal domain-containing protein n=1 Tax=Priestia megaterium TaxID=1404 RepID=UPI002E21FF2E|nr:Rho termination factor N-terminal domain-containing protein [Priestia megaterium]MED4234409.1 Rho termination factor N-terminal domain-containing protein [Priestia megaterium]